MPIDPTTTPGPSSPSELPQSETQWVLSKEDVLAMGGMDSLIALRKELRGREAKGYAWKPDTSDGGFKPS